jgi:hypothetical protein
MIDYVSDFCTARLGLRVFVSRANFSPRPPGEEDFLAKAPRTASHSDAVIPSTREGSKKDFSLRSK